MVFNTFEKKILGLTTYYMDTMILYLSFGSAVVSGRVFDSRPRGSGFEPYRYHCVVSLSKTLYSLLSTGSTQEGSSLVTPPPSPRKWHLGSIHDYRIIATLGETRSVI